jgi:signal peptidase I
VSNEPATRPRRRAENTFLVALALIAFTGPFLIKTQVAEAFYIPSASMESTLHGCDGCQGDRILVEKVSYRLHPPQRGDIVVFRGSRTWPANTLVKRVIGLPGDHITWSNGTVHINGAPLEEPYAVGPIDEFTALTVPPDHLWVLGDNRPASADSRFHGPVPIADVIGRATTIVWPLDRAQTLP